MYRIAVLFLATFAATSVAQQLSPVTSPRPTPAPLQVPNPHYRLARDLHDTLLQTIQGSRLVADELLTEPTDSVRTQLAVKRLAASLDRATQEGRAALESLRISKSHDLVALFCDAAEECHSNRSVESTVHLVGSCKDMHPFVRNEVYRIGYEAVQNACIHSGGTRLKIILEYSHDFTLRVQDNGCRIDPEILRVGKPVTVV
jgi:signal transduction histidine kinase